MTRTLITLAAIATLAVSAGTASAGTSNKPPTRTQTYTLNNTMVSGYSRRRAADERDHHEGRRHLRSNPPHGLLSHTRRPPRGRELGPQVHGLCPASRDARRMVFASLQPDTVSAARIFSWTIVASVIAAGSPSGTPSRSMSAARAGCVASRSSTRPPSKQLGTKPGDIVQQKSDHLPPGDELGRLPHAGRHDVLQRRAREDVAAEDDLLVRAVRVQQHEAQRVARVEVPHLVECQPVEERPARRVVAEEARTPPCRPDRLRPRPPRSCRSRRRTSPRPGAASCRTSRRSVSRRGRCGDRTGSLADSVSGRAFRRQPARPDGPRRTRHRRERQHRRRDRAAAARGGRVGRRPRARRRDEARAAAAAARRSSATSSATPARSSPLRSMRSAGSTCSSTTRASSPSRRSP